MKGGRTLQQSPQHPLDPLAVRVWTISQILINLLLFLLVIGLYLVVDWLGWPSWLTPLTFIVAILYIPIVFLVPKLRWKYFRYEASAKEIYIQSGFLLISKTLIPMVRVQHVNTRQGPLLRRYGLSELEIHTAGGGSFLIPVLNVKEADELRNRIGSWVRVAEDE